MARRTVTISGPAHELEALRMEAARRGVSVSALCREAVRRVIVDDAAGDGSLSEWLGEKMRAYHAAIAAAESRAAEEAGRAEGALGLLEDAVADHVQLEELTGALAATLAMIGGCGTVEAVQGFAERLREEFAEADAERRRELPLRWARGLAAKLAEDGTALMEAAIRRSAPKSKSEPWH